MDQYNETTGELLGQVMEAICTSSWTRSMRNPLKTAMT